MKSTRSRNNWAWIAGGLLAVLAASVLIVNGEKVESLWVQSVMREAGVAILLAVALSLVWELIGKRMFLAEVMSARAINSDVDRWKIKSVSMAWDQVDWAHHFQGARELDIVQAYGYSWGSGNRQALLEEFIAKKGNKLRVVLPDPECQWLMEALAQRFDTTVDTVQDRVREAAERYSALRALGKGSVRIYYREGEPMYAGYRFDRDVVITLYSHKKAKSSRIPTIVVEGGELADFVKSDFEEMFNSSIEVAQKTLSGIRS